MRLLIVTKHYPPRNSARSLQIQKVAEAIEGTGVDVRVIAGLEKKVASNQGVPPNEKVVYVPYHCVRDGVRFVGRALRFLDDEIGSINHLDGWVRGCKAEALRLLETFQPDCLLTSSVPFPTHLVGLAIRRVTGIPWVASFSDPWPFWLCPPPYYRKPLPILRQMNMTALARVIEACDAVHMPSRYGLAWTAKASGLPIDSKGVAIPHIGFSSPANCVSRDHVGWLAHVGHLSRERVSEAVLRGVDRAHRRIPHRFRGLLCVGWVCHEFREMVQHMGLDQIVRFTGRLSASEAVTVIHSATALLVVEADMDLSPFLPSKFADYALAGKPVLAVTPVRSALRDFLSRDGGGIALGHDGDAIAEAIASLFSQDALNGFRPFDANGRLAEAFRPITIGNQYRELLTHMLSKKRTAKDLTGRVTAEEPRCCVGSEEIGQLR